MSTPAGANSDLSLYHLLDPEVLADPYPLYSRLRTEDPVHWDPFLHAWVVTRYEDVVTVLTKFSADRTPTPEKLQAMGLASLSPIAAVMVKQMLFMDPPVHTRIRGLASAAFTPARVQHLRSQVQEVVNQLLDQVQDRGEMEVMSEFANPLPAVVTAGMLGVPISDHEQLKNWSADFAEMLGNFQHNPGRADKVLKSTEEMVSYFRDAMRDIRQKPCPGLIHALVSAEVDGDRLSDEEIIANCVVTMVGGQETTTNLIGNGLVALAEHPAEKRRLIEHPDLIKTAVEEVLRYESSNQLGNRMTTEHVELGGIALLPGTPVTLCIGAANRDPAHFGDPERFDIARTPNRHLAFATGAHQCAGMALARLEGAIAMSRFLKRFPNYALNGTPLRGGRVRFRGFLSVPCAAG